MSLAREWGENASGSMKAVDETPAKKAERSPTWVVFRHET